MKFFIPYLPCLQDLHNKIYYQLKKKGEEYFVFIGINSRGASNGFHADVFSKFTYSNRVPQQQFIVYKVSFLKYDVTIVQRRAINAVD